MKYLRIVSIHPTGKQFEFSLCFFHQFEQQFQFLRLLHVIELIDALVDQPVMLTFNALNQAAESGYQFGDLRWINHGFRGIGFSAVKNPKRRRRGGAK